ncbi:MAG: dienelactone hydrolase family protein [Candidatus Magasanikbacteria bacterium]|nr:dienelactone hydrolase family protein [Candidatus Magasanikbacteria bacterium]
MPNSFRNYSANILTADGKNLPGTVACPSNARGLILFAHGSGSSRLSPRNRLVAAALEKINFATFLFDLLTDEEESANNRALVFNIDFLANRLIDAANWVKNQPELSSQPIGYFGASTGAAAALQAAAKFPDNIFAVVSRGGRPDMAGDFLPRVHAPTLLIVGGADEDVLELNRQALELLSCKKELSVIPGATHLFEEAGALEQVARLARQWFINNLPPHD